MRVSTSDSKGTGFVFEVRENTALILTAHHVVDTNGKIEVETSKRRRYTATLLGYDAYRDIAVLSVCCGPFQALSLMERSRTISIGSEVLSIGYSLGMAGTPTVTRGIVSAVRRDEDMDAWV